MRVLAVVAVASAVSAALILPTASADKLTDQRARVSKQLAQSRGALGESTDALNRAVVRVSQVQARLDSARARLARTRQELAAARAKDRAMAARLKQAKADLAKAKAAVVAGQKALDAETAMAGNMIRDQYQQQTNLLPIAMLVGNSTADLQTRLQWSTTMFDTTQAQIDRLEVIQARLTAQRARMAALEVQVSIDRKAAAQALSAKRALERHAAYQAAAVATLLSQRRAQMRSAAKEVAADRARYASLTRERAAVEQRIASRIAKARAEARRAAARRAAEARRTAERARRQVASKPRPGRSTSGSADSRRSSGGTAHHGFSYPVSAPITSPYGMRFHPVLKYWKLHDGTDFGAGCGTVIRSAYSGRVAERYFNAGYGNRLLIDHGYIDGSYVTTGYNHATHYIVGVGQRVSRGQIIGYVGTTGYSTGCHLHLMLWRNGRVVNPMSWF